MGSKSHLFVLPLCLMALGGALPWEDEGEQLVLETPFSAPVSGSLPTRIDLNDTSESEIRGYYSSISSLADSERTGTNLLKNLKPILQNMTYFSYANVWKIYEITDRDWTLSPASADSYATYDSSTNTYTSYTYGTSNSNGRNNPYVMALYRNRDESGSILSDGRVKAWGDHGVTGINREHTWPQSRGFKSDDDADGPAGTDVHHLMAGDAKVNQDHHNNNCYGNVDESKSYDNASSYKSYLSGNLRGSPANKDISHTSYTVFEPQDCDKGNIARACFYMVACYNNYSGTDTITQYNPNLVLIDDAYDAGESVISSASSPISMGILSDLLEWNRLDPPDEYEIHRNNLIYENYQKNRNPFIDFPEWAEYVWGDKANEGVATPATDKLNVFFDAEGGGGSSSSEPTSSVPASSEPASSEDPTSSSEDNPLPGASQFRFGCGGEIIGISAVAFILLGGAVGVAIWRRKEK